MLEVTTILILVTEPQRLAVSCLVEGGLVSARVPC
jgi:hypothetical protein